MRNTRIWHTGTNIHLPSKALREEIHNQEGIGYNNARYPNTHIGLQADTGVELMLNAASINFMAFNRFLAPDPIVGQIYTLFIMGIAAAEAAIALSIIVAVFRRIRSINIERVQELRG